MLRGGKGGGGKDAKKALTYANLSKYVYGGKDADASLLKDADGDWSISNVAPDLELENQKTGFKSMLFERTNNDGIKEYCYAYAGTDGLNWKDIKTDIKQFFGLLTGQYKQAVNNAKSLIQDFHLDNIDRKSVV